MYSKKLLQVAYIYVQNWASAEDRVQDAFLKAYRSINKPTESKVFPWLAKIVINECKTFRRRSWREVITTFLPERVDSSTEETYLTSIDNNILHQAILNLPEKYRAPIVLHYFNDLSIEEISEILGVNVGTIKSRLYRGRELLRKCLKEVEADEFGTTNQSYKTSF